MKDIYIANLANFDEGLEDGAAFSAYHRGRKVVDLWGGVADTTTGRPWEEDALVLVYSTTKGAINSLTLELARELGPRGIRVNALSSGATITEGAASLGVYEGSEYADEFKALTPLGRLGTPEDLAKAAVFLASDESRWITGDIVKASGGMI